MLATNLRGPFLGIRAVGAAPRRARRGADREHRVRLGVSGPWRRGRPLRDVEGRRSSRSRAARLRASRPRASPSTRSPPARSTARPSASWQATRSRRSPPRPRSAGSRAGGDRCARRLARLGRRVLRDRPTLLADGGAASKRNAPLRRRSARAPSPRPAGARDRALRGADRSQPGSEDDALGEHVIRPRERVTRAS